MVTDNCVPRVSFRRLRAVLALRGQTLTDMATSVECTLSHVRVVLRGTRQPSQALRERLEHVLTQEEWSFARGEVDTLRDHQSKGMEVVP